MPPRIVSSDHDLLIRIDTRLEILSQSVAQNHSDVTSRINVLDTLKANYTDLDVLRKAIDSQQESAADLTEKVDWTRRMLWMAIGGLAVLEIVVPLILHGR
jgi:hypothetical protein